MDNKNLLADSKSETYADGVQNQQLWRLVGMEIARLRGRAGYPSTLALSKAFRDAPAKNTLDDIERGRPGTIDKLEGYCTVLGYDLAAVLRTVLDAESDESVLSADALWVGRMYQDGPNEDLRHAIRDAAKAQDALRRAALVSSPALPSDSTASAGGSRGRGRTLRHHR